MSNPRSLREPLQNAESPAPRLSDPGIGKSLKNQSILDGKVPRFMTDHD